LNLSQPLGSSAAKTGTVLSNASVTESDARISVYRDYDVRGYYRGRCALLQFLDSPFDLIAGAAAHLGSPENLV
jgi:hypothetical protein